MKWIQILGAIPLALRLLRPVVPLLAYAESMAWRKQNGISTGEAVKVATRRIA